MERRKGPNRRRSLYDHPPGRKQRYKGTDIELKMEAILRQLGPYGKLWVRQYRLQAIDFAYRGHCFDFAIPDLNILLECDGCLWHGCQRCHPGSKLRERDELERVAAAAVGWRVLHFLGHMIKGEPDRIVGLLRAELRGYTGSLPSQTRGS